MAVDQRTSNLAVTNISTLHCRATYYSPSSSVVATTEVDAGPSPCVLYALATTWYDVNLPRPRSEKACEGAPEEGRSRNSRPVVRPTALQD